MSRSPTDVRAVSARYPVDSHSLLVPVVLAPGMTIKLRPGARGKLIRAIVEDFAPRFVPGSQLVYVGDSGKPNRKWAYFDEATLTTLGVRVDTAGKLPDVVLYCAAKGWLLLVESVASHGPVDAKRHAELVQQFACSSASLVVVTAFPDRATVGRHLGEIAWDTAVWVADSPTHLIHFNGERFLGPYPKESTV